MVGQGDLLGLGRFCALPSLSDGYKSANDTILSKMINNWSARGEYPEIQQALNLIKDDLRPFYQGDGEDCTQIFQAAGKILAEKSWTLPKNSSTLHLTGKQRLLISSYLLKHGYYQKNNHHVISRSLANRDKNFGYLLDGDWIGFYTIPALAARNQLKQTLLSVSKPYQRQNTIDYYFYQMPEYWSREQAFWVSSRNPGLTVLDGHTVFFCDMQEFNFLHEVQIINKYQSVYNIKSLNIPQPLFLPWHELLNIDDKVTTMHNIEQELSAYRCLLLILCFGMMQPNLLAHENFDGSVTGVWDFAIESYLNIKRLGQAEVFRAYANLLAIHSYIKSSNWVLMAGHDELSTLIGSKPVFYIRIDKNIHSITEKLMQAGFAPRLDEYKKIICDFGANSLLGMQPNRFLNSLNQHTIDALTVLNTSTTQNQG